MQSVSALYTMPTILSTLKPAANSTTPKAQAASASGTTGTGGTTSIDAAATALGSTFLNLLATELQNQDPTAPVDSTAMVGQMISLNQLDQLISINQGINSASNSTTKSTPAAQAAGATPSAAAASAANGGLAAMLSPSSAAAATSQLPFDPNTMMPLSSSNAGALAATINSSLNAANLGLSGTNNNTSGGK